MRKDEKKEICVSVLMTAFNEEAHIQFAIESVLHQSFPDFEFIIIDDKSDDDTWNIIQSYARIDSRIHAYRGKVHKNITYNRNLLLKKARGKYIMWQDADDISVKSRIEKQYKYLEEHPYVGVVGGYLQFFNESSATSIRKYAEHDVELRRNIFRFSPVAQPACMMRRKLLSIVGMYDTTYSVAEDLDLFFRIGQVYKFANIPSIVIYYREHAKSATFQKLKDMEICTLKIRRKYTNCSQYTMTLLDIFYNLLQLVSLYIIPSRLRISLFTLLRNSNENRKLANEFLKRSGILYV